MAGVRNTAHEIKGKIIFPAVGGTGYGLTNKFLFHESALTSAAYGAGEAVLILSASVISKAITKRRTKSLTANHR